MYESAVAQSVPLQHTHPAERVGSLCHSECRDRRDCLDFRRVTSPRPLVNTAIPLFFPPPTLHRRARPIVVLIAPPRPTRSTDVEWRTPGPRWLRCHRALAYMNHGAVKRMSNGTATFSLSAHVRVNTDLRPWHIVQRPLKRVARAANC